MKSVLNETGAAWDETNFLYSPMGAAMRIAEGYDSFRNLGRSTNANTTEIERASMILCGLAQLGGLLFTISIFCLTCILCMAAPAGSMCCVVCSSLFCRGFQATFLGSKKRRWRRDYRKVQRVESSDSSANDD